MTKKHNLFLLAMLLGSWVMAQSNTFEYAVKGNASEITVEMTQLLSDVEITGISGSTIKITVEGYEGVPDKAKGLKPLTGAGPENTGIGLSVEQKGNKIVIAMGNSKAKDASYTIQLPKELNLYLDYGSPFAGDVKIAKMNGEVEVKTLSGDLDLIDVTGPIVANSISSDINITISDLSQSSPTSINATSGDIDLTMPASAKGTFKFNTMTGGVYTDMDFDMGDTEGNNLIMGHSSTGKLNGGGVEVNLNSISGDIYIRKR